MTPAMQQLFDKDPLELTKEDIDQVVLYVRSLRKLPKPKAPPKPRAKVTLGLPKADVKLGLS